MTQRMSASDPRSRPPAELFRSDDHRLIFRELFHTHVAEACSAHPIDALQRVLARNDPRVIAVKIEDLVDNTFVRKLDESGALDRLYVSYRPHRISALIEGGSAIRIGVRHQPPT